MLDRVVDDEPAVEQNAKLLHFWFSMFNLLQFYLSDSTETVFIKMSKVLYFT